MPPSFEKPGMVTPAIVQLLPKRYLNRGLQILHRVETLPQIFNTFFLFFFNWNSKFNLVASVRDSIEVVAPMKFHSAAFKS